MNKNTKAVFRKVLPVFLTTVAGAAGGFLYYRFVGCASGSCVISSSPVLSTLYGGIIGGLLGSALRPGACCACGRTQEHDPTE